MTSDSGRPIRRLHRPAPDPAADPVAVAAAVTDPERLRELEATGLLDSPAEEMFDRLTRLAARALGTPIALVSLVDHERQFLKSAIGLPQPFAQRREMPLSYSFCQYVVAGGAPLVVADTLADPLVRTNDSTVALGLRAYAGMPLRTSTDQVLGAFSVADLQPRDWSADELQLLEDLASIAMTEIELRHQIAERRRAALIAERRSVHVRLLELGTVTSARARTLDEGLQAVLNGLCRELGWAISQAYRCTGVDELESHEAWCTSDPERYQSFRELSRRLRFRSEVGLPGRAMAKRCAVWIEDMVEAEYSYVMPRAEAARAAGLHTGFAFPVRLQGELLAVIECFSTAPVAVNEELLEVVEHLGRQLGRIVERERAEGELQRYAQAGRRLGGVVTELRESVETLVRELRPETEPQLYHFLMLTLERVRRLRRVEERLRRVTPDAGAEPDQAGDEGPPVQHDVELAEMVHEVIRRQRAIRPAFEVHFQEPAVPVRVLDHRHLVRLIELVVGEAAAYTPGGETLTVTITAPETSGPVELRAGGEGLVLPPGTLGQVLARCQPYLPTGSEPSAAGLLLTPGGAEIRTKHLCMESSHERGGWFTLILPTPTSLAGDAAATGSSSERRPPDS